MREELIIDADSVSYKAAAANEVKSIIVKNRETGEEQKFPNRTKWKATLEDSEENYEVEDVQDPRHIQYGKTLIKDMINGYKLRTGIKQATIYISGENNFRDSIPLPAAHTLPSGAVIAGRYKSNRDDNIRPVQLKELRTFMIEELGAIVVNGMEVDDMSSIRAYEGFKAGDKVVQVTEDKDALGCTGWLWNPAKDKEPRLIKGFGELHREGNDVKGTGRLWFYYQVLYGDSVDNYHGVDLAKIIADKAGKKLTFGKVGAYDVLKNCTTDAEALGAVYNKYLEWYPEPVEYVDHLGNQQVKSACEIMDMYVQCAHMRRWLDDSIDTQAMLSKVGVL